MDPTPFPLPKWPVRSTQWLLTSRSAEQQGGTGEQEHQHKVLQWGRHTWASHGSSRQEKNKKKGGDKKKSQTPKRGNSSCFRTAFRNSLGLQSRLEGQMADEGSSLRSYSITAACLHASGAGSAQRTRGKRLALPPSPEASPPPGRTAARSRPRWEPGYFPRSFTTSKKAPGWEGNISRRAHSGVSQRGPCGLAGARRKS